MQDEKLNVLPKPTIGVGGIIFNSKRQVLLIQRNQPPALGFWSIPGGKLEPGENLAETCRREIKEETGLNVNVISIVAVVERRIEGFHYVIIDFLALLTDQEVAIPVAQSDVADARWVNIDQVSNYDLVEGLGDIILRTHAGHKKHQAAGLYDVNSTGNDYIFPS